MIIYQTVKRFHNKTGEPYEEKEFKEMRCDFTGEIINEHQELYVGYELNYGSADPCYGASGDEFEFCDKHDLEAFEFLSNTYHFIQDFSRGRFTEMEMMSHYLIDADSSSDCTFASMCRDARINTAKKLIESGKIQPADLSSEFLEDEDEDIEE